MGDGLGSARLFIRQPAWELLDSFLARWLSPLDVLVGLFPAQSQLAKIQAFNESVWSLSNRPEAHWLAGYLHPASP